MINQAFIKKFEVPEAAYPFLEKMFTEEEIDFVSRMGKENFAVADVYALGIRQPDKFIKDSYRRGIISIADDEKGLYKISDFYGRLDIFSITETELYKTFPDEVREALEAWYFDAFYDSLTADENVRPTADIIMPVEDVLAFIDKQERPVYLNYCDCRSLRGECGFQTRTCITYKNGINTFVHRGLSEEIDKEKAKAVVKEADKSGLMHTVNPNGICNCCSDCCYLFRGQKRRNSAGFWPETSYVVALEEDVCISCGKCLRTCHFHVFSKEGTVKADTTRCVGCGICVNGCPVKALQLNRTQP